MKREPIDIELSKLAHAPWNPRAQIKPSDVEDLTASIKADGLIQRLVVVADPATNGYTVIAGNRRLVACNAAGMDVIPCELLDVDETTAKRMTLIENLQRRDVDPVLEAELVQSLIDSGMTIEEIASETGRGEKWVWRRKQLTNLDRRYIAELDKRKATATVDCLERIARYPMAVQDACLKRFGEYLYEGRQISWNDVRYIFESCTRNINNALFNKGACRKCGNNSANAPTLFGIDESRQCGVCLDSECFIRKTKAWIDGEIKKSEKSGHKVVRVKDLYKIDNYWDRSNRYNEDHPVMYVVEDETPFITYGKDSTEAKEAESEEDKAQAEKDKRRKAAKKSCKALSEFLNGDGVIKRLVAEKFCLVAAGGIPVHVLILLQNALGSYDYDDGTSIGDKEWDWLARYPESSGECVSGDELEKMLDRIVMDIQDELTGYTCIDAANNLLELFPKLRDIIPPTDLSNIEKAKE